MTIQDQLDRASSEYPSEAFARGHRLHVFRETDGPSDASWCVWLNTEAGDFDGLCLACGHPTRDGAVAEAVQILEQAVAFLQRPPVST